MSSAGTTTVTKPPAYPYRSNFSLAAANSTEIRKTFSHRIATFSADRLQRPLVGWRMTLDHDEIWGRLPPDSFPSRNLPVGFQAGRVDRRDGNGEKWWLAVIAPTAFA